MIKGFDLVTYQNIRDGLHDYREKGALRGVYLGYPNLHEHYTMALPGCTTWTGFPQSGKTEFLLDCLLNTSVFYGWKHLLYVPDIGDKVEVTATLIHKISGMTFDKRFVNSNYIAQNDVDKHLQWILDHFYIIYKEDLKAKMTPYEFWEYAAVLKKDVIGGIQTTVIDSWKDMRHDTNSFGRDDKYLEDVLSYCNAMSEAHKQHHHIIIHPTKTEADKDGKRRAPGPYDLKGGSEWYNSGKCMITVHRQDGKANEVEIIITKAKPKSVALQGKVEMYFDAKQAKYYWIDNGNKKYANKDYVKPTGLSVFDNQQDGDDDLPF